MRDKSFAYHLWRNPADSAIRRRPVEGLMPAVLAVAQQETSWDRADAHNYDGEQFLDGVKVWCSGVRWWSELVRVTPAD